MENELVGLILFITGIAISLALKIPKVQACLETLKRGVQKIHISDGRLRHSLLLEVYTTKGVGTQIVK